MVLRYWLCPVGRDLFRDGLCDGPKLGSQSKRVTYVLLVTRSSSGVWFASDR